MDLKILGSCSKGNCYILDNGKEALVIECGIPFKQVQAAVDYDIMRIKGAVVSHEHGDHAKHVGRFIESRIPVYLSRGTARALHLTTDTRQVVEATESVINKIGNFQILPFDVEHDAAQPFGYLIHHPETGTVLFATDTYYLRNKFEGLNNILIECNYRLDILDANVAAGTIPPALRQRTIKSHCSFDTCREILQANDLSGVNNIVLIHLSSANADAKAFKAGIEEATGKTVSIAEPGMVIHNFEKSPF